jgi:hypothetical protein
MHPEVESAFDIMENPFHQIKMRFSRRVHVEACLLHSMSNIWVSQSQVLQSTCIAAILGGVGEKSTICSGELASYINRCSTRVAVNHASTLEKLEGILSLREHHA